MQSIGSQDETKKNTTIVRLRSGLDLLLGFFLVAYRLGLAPIAESALIASFVFLKEQA